jgi:UDP-2-acetamido-3-amino-2,3-dideoxy-glucuronate N-acetyltransferase
MICDSDPRALAEALESAPGTIGVAKMGDVLEDPAVHGVVVASPAELHHPLALLALQSNRDVFVEKPLALNVDHGRELLETAAEHGRVLMVGHLLEYHPAVQRLHELVAAGELGRLQYLYSNRLNLGRFRREENILWSFAPHDIDVLLLLVGEQPVRVSAHGGYYLHEAIADVTVSALEFRSGIKAHVFVSWLHPYKEQRLVVVGDRQMAVFDGAARNKLTLFPQPVIWRDEQPVPKPSQGTAVAVSDEEPLRRECLEFLRACRERRSPRTDGANGLRVLEVLSACQRSLDSGGAAVALSSSS